MYHTISKLKNASLKYGISEDQLIDKLLGDYERSTSIEQHNLLKNKKQRPIKPSNEELPYNKQIDIQADFSKLFPIGSGELIELLRRITQSIEKNRKASRTRLVGSKDRLGCFI